MRDGDHYVLNGAKMFITNGVHGDLYFIAARTDPEAKGSRAITMFIVEKGTPGFRVGRALDKTGWRSSDTAELVFEDCRVPAENVLGEPNRGFYSIMANFQTERLVIGAMAMAEAREAIRLTFDYVNQRTAFGAPLWEKQTIRQRLSRRLAEVEAARQLVHHTAWLDAQGTRLRGAGLDGQGAGRRPGERGALRLRAVPRRRGLHARDGGRAHGARRPRAVDRRRRLGGHAGGGRQAVRAGLVRLTAATHRRPAMSEPRYWDDYEVGQKFPLGSTTFTEQEIVDFARQFDPQPFHVDAEAAKASMFGGLIASGWHVAAKMMRLFVDNYVDRRTALGSPGLDELRWLKPVRPGDTLTGWVECAAKVPSKSRPTHGRHPRALARHQPEGRAGDDDQGHQHGAAEARA